MKKTKQIMSIIITLAIIVSTTTIVLPAENIKVLIDGKQIYFDVQPTIINSRIMVPVRAIFEALGANVDWNDSTQTVTATKQDTTIKLKIDSPTMYVNNKTKSLDAPATVQVNRTLVPIRAISEAFGCEVDWDEKSKTVSISTKNIADLKWVNLFLENINLILKFETQCMECLNMYSEYPDEDTINLFYRCLNDAYETANDANEICLMFENLEMFSSELESIMAIYKKILTERLTYYQIVEIIKGTAPYHQNIHSMIKNIQYE